MLRVTTIGLSRFLCILIVIENIQGATKHTEQLRLALNTYRVNGVRNVQGNLYILNCNLHRNSCAKGLLDRKPHIVIRNVFSNCAQKHVHGHADIVTFYMRGWYTWRRVAGRRNGKGLS